MLSPRALVPTASRVLACLLALGVGAAAWAPAAQADARRDELFAQAKKIYDKRDSLMMHKSAAESFSALAKAYPEDKELQVWCARTAYYTAHRIEDAGLKKKVAGWGVQCANRVKKKSPEDYDGRFWWLMCRFKGEQASSILRALEHAPMIRTFLAEMVKDEPKRAEAYMALGAIYRGLPGPPVSFGDLAKGLQLLEKANRLEPNNAEILLELAGAYADDGQTDKARKLYNQCISRGKGPKDLAWETQDARDYAKKMLAELD